MDAHPVMLTAEQEKALLHAYRNDGDEAALAALIHHYQPLVRAQARKTQCHDDRLDDLISGGNEGLIEGIRRFDLTQGFRLGTFVVWYVKNGVQQAYYTDRYTVRRPGHGGGRYRGIARRAIDAQITLGFSHKTSLSDADIEALAAHLGETPQTVARSLAMFHPDFSVDAPVGQGKDGPTILDTLESECETPEDIITHRQESTRSRRLVAAGLKSLSDRERAIVTERYMRDPPATLDELGRRFGLSRERIRQIEKAALEKAKKGIRAADWREMAPRRHNINEPSSHAMPARAPRQASQGYPQACA
jgi:RNA polymerase sigma-32 factor